MRLKLFIEWCEGTESNRRHRDFQCFVPQSMGRLETRQLTIRQRFATVRSHFQAARLYPPLSIIARSRCRLWCSRFLWGAAWVLVALIYMGIVAGCYWVWSIPHY